MSEMIHAPISYGELFDKITILELKERHIIAEDKRANVLYELEALRKLWAGLAVEESAIGAAMAGLRDVNARLWAVEDELREMEAKGQFDAAFITAARSVYRLNDERGAHKKAINLALGSPLVEEKSYANWT